MVREHEIPSLRQQEMKSIVRRALLLLLHHFQFSLPDT